METRSQANSLRKSDGEFSSIDMSNTNLSQFPSKQSNKWANAKPSNRLKPKFNTGIDWSKASKVKPSADGASGGVMFVTINGKTMILKPVQSASGVITGEYLMEKAGIVTPNSKIIEKGKSEWNDIISLLNDFYQEERNQLYYKKINEAYDFDEFSNENKKINVDELKELMSMMPLDADKVRKINSETDTELAHWKRNIDIFTEGHIALQDNMVELGGAEFDSFKKGSGIINLFDEKLLYNIGKTLAIDTFMGNGDRFENMNTGNAFIMPSENIGAIDTVAVLPSYDDFIRTQTPGRDEDPVERWVNFLLTQGSVLPEYSAMDERYKHGRVYGQTSDTAVFSQFNEWFIGKFKPNITKFLEANQIPATQEDWIEVEKITEKGFNDGKQFLNEFLVDKNSNDKIEEITSIFGSDRNFNKQALEVKKTYYTVLFGGYSPKQAREAALKHANELIRGKI